MLNLFPDSPRFWRWACIISVVLALLSLFPIVMRLLQSDPTAIKAKNVFGVCLWTIFALVARRKVRSLSTDSPHPHTLIGLVVIAAFLLPAPLPAAEAPSPCNRQPAVTFPLELERWVTAKTATVTVEGRLAVQPAQRIKAQQRLAALFRSLIPEEPPDRLWRWTFIRIQPDQADLLRVIGQAQIQVSLNAIGNIWEEAKAASQPGLTLRIVRVDWRPTWEEWEEERTKVRKMVYQRVREEMQRLSAQLPGTWHLGQLLFEPSGSNPNLSIPEQARLQTLDAKGIAAPRHHIVRAERLRVRASVTLCQSDAQQ